MQIGIAERTFCLFTPAEDQDRCFGQACCFADDRDFKFHFVRRLKVQVSSEIRA